MFYRQENGLNAGRVSGLHYPATVGHDIGSEDFRAVVSKLRPVHHGAVRHCVARRNMRPFQPGICKTDNAYYNIYKSHYNIIISWD